MSSPSPAQESARKVIFARVDEFKKNFSAESDRACVVLVAARLDELLHQALSAHLLPPPTRDDNLLDSDRALGTFSSRIDACYRLGLIDAEFCRALHLLRRIRNEFAHESSDSSLEKSPHRERILQLSAPVVHLGNFEELRTKQFAKESHCRAMFSMCAWLLVIRLEKVVHEVRRIDSAPITLVPAAWMRQPNKEPEANTAAVTSPPS
jgi:hypothetical protein